MLFLELLLEFSVIKALCFSLDFDCLCIGILIGVQLFLAFSRNDFKGMLWFLFDYRNENIFDAVFKVFDRYQVDGFMWKIIPYLNCAIKRVFLYSFKLVFSKYSLKLKVVFIGRVRYTNLLFKTDLSYTYRSLQISTI